MTDSNGPRKPPGRGRKPNGRHGISTRENVVEGAFGDSERKPKTDVAIPPVGTQEPDDTRRRAYLRLGKRWSELFDMVKRGDTTWETLAEGLDDEELARGQLRDVNGKFSGRPPTVIPRAFYNACVRELMNRGSVQWRKNYLGSIDVMTQIANDKRVKPADRIKAAQFVIERLEGKVPDRLIVSEADPWQEALDGILTDTENGTIARAAQYLGRTTGDTSEE